MNDSQTHLKIRLYVLWELLETKERVSIMTRANVPVDLYAFKWWQFPSYQQNAMQSDLQNSPPAVGIVNEIGSQQLAMVG